MHNRVRAFIFAILLLVVATSVQAAQVVDRIVAVVNGSIITLSELDSNVNLLMQAQISQGIPVTMGRDEMRKMVLDNMINNMLIEDKANSLKIDVSVSDIQNFVEDFKEQNHLTEDELVKQLRMQNKTRKDYEQQVKDNLLRSRLLSVMVQRKAVVTDQEIRDYYNEHKGNLNLDPTFSQPSSGDAVDISLIVLAPEEDPHQLREAINSGKISFEQAAISKSIGPAADSGGHLGKLGKSDLAPELREAVSKTAPGSISQPFLIDGKPALVFVAGDEVQAKQESGEESSSADPVDQEFKESKEKIRALLGEQKMQKLYDNFIKRLREQAVVDIRL